MQIYEKPYEFIKPLQITLLAKITCPFCKAAKEQLEWLQTYLLPKVRYDIRYVGHIHSKLSVDSLQRIDNTSYDVEITQFYHNFIRTFYPNTSQLLPITVIGNLQDFMRFNVLKPTVLTGCDRFMTELQKYPKEALKSLTERELKIIKSSALDGLIYSEAIYYNYVIPMGINDSNITLMLNKKRKVYDKTVSKLRQETIKLNTSQNQETQSIYS